MSPRICCVGDVISDVVVHLDSEPEQGTDTPATIVTTRGGSAAGVTVAVSAAGGVGRFVGSVGDDHTGAELVADLRENGVETYTVAVGTTGTIVVLVDGDGERTFLTDRGAAIELASMPTGALDDVDLLHVPAYSFLDGPLAETAETMIGIAVDRTIPISVSTSSVAALRQFGRDNFLSLLEAIRPTYVIANGDEYRFLMGDEPCITSAEHTVITHGARPAVLRKVDGTEVRVGPTATTVSDTTGAGDAFTGGFLVARLGGAGYEDALTRGHNLAARVLSKAGFQL